MIHDQGAYTPQGINLPYNASTAVPGPYILPAYEIAVQVVETNKVATMPVRGAGYPEGAFAMERVLDAIARKLDLDRAEVRRRNLVPAEKIPYTTPLKTRSGSSITIDSGDFPRCQQLVLDAVDYAGFAARQAKARAEGRYLGIGIGNGVKGTGRGPFESGIVRVGRSGRISVYTGAMPMGQGIRTALAQICAEQFNVHAAERHGDRRRHRRHSARARRLRQPPDHHRRLRGAHGGCGRARKGAGGRGASARGKSAGSGIEGRPRRRRRRSRAPASRCRRWPRRCQACLAIRMPGDFEPGLESLQNFIPGALTYGIGCHAVEVEVDVDTCAVRILSYAVVNDSGRVINPMIVEGQIVGGVVHAIGNSLFEWMGYDERRSRSPRISPTIFWRRRPRCRTSK